MIYMIKLSNIPPNFQHNCHLIILFFGLLFFIGCQEIEPTVVLEVNVIDKLSELRDSVTVSIYTTEEDWANEVNPLQNSQLTNKNGRVRFFGLAAGDYFIDTKLNDSSSNLEGKTRLSIDIEGSFSLEPTTLIVDKNLSEMLSEAQGKKWQMTRAELFEIDYTDDLSCLLDDELIFYKGNRSGKFERRVGIDVCSGESNSSGTWRLNDSGTEMTVETENGTYIYTILQVSSQSLILRQVFDFDIFEYDIYYEVVE